MGVDNAIEGNTRLNKCIAFCRTPPSAAAMLVLHLAGEPPLQLGEWTRSEITESLGHELESLMTEAHEEAGIVDSKFAATFKNEEGRAIKTKTFTVRTRREIQSDDAASIAASLDGSAQSSNVLTQQTLLALVRMFLTGIQANQQTSHQQTQSLLGVIDTLGDKLVQSEERSTDAKLAYHELRELLSDNNTKEPAEMTPAQQKFFELAGAALPSILAKMSG